MDTESMGKSPLLIVVMGFKVWCNVYSDQEHAVNHVNAFRKEFSDNLKR